MTGSANQALRQGLAATVIFFALLETFVRVAYFVRSAFVEVVPVPYRLGDDYGPTPPWIDRDRVLEPDDRLLWRNRSGARVTYAGLFLPFASEEERAALTQRFSPWAPGSLRQAQPWDVAVNSRGFRDGEFSDRKRDGTFRILCLGDSWTFGANVPQDETYPRALARRLDERFPGRKIEVLNLGVLGYSSFQGRQLLLSRALDWDADLIVLGFGMNDGQVAGYRDKDLAAMRARPGARLVRALEHSELFKLLRYWALRLRDQPRSGGDAFRAAVATTYRKSAPELAPLEPWTRVSLADYEANLRDMIDAARSRGAAVALLDAEIERGAYGEALARISRAAGVPLVRADRLIARAKQSEDRRLAASLGLAPSSVEDLPDGASIGPRRLRRDARSDGLARADLRVPVVIRAYAPDGMVPTSLFVVGEDPALGLLVPNHVALRDDGLEGDERAGDGVWSVRVSLPLGALVRYALTNSGREGKWEGLDVPAIRSLVVPATARQTVFSRVERFGSVSFQSDAWHTDAHGLAWIAEAMAAAVERQPGFVRYVRALPTDPLHRSAALAAPHARGG
jgi:lysophospholipase L1-like esterase